MRIWLYTPEVFVFHAYERIVGAISKYKYYAVYLYLYTYYVYISAYWASAKRPHRSAPTKAQRKRCDSGAIQALPSSIPFLTLFRPSEARTTASAPKTRKKRPRLRISSNKQKQVREVSVRFMVIGGEPPKKIDIRQNACYSLSK